MRISDWSSDVCSSDLQIVEIDAVPHRFGIVEIDLDQLGQRKITLAVARRANLALDGVAGAQAIFADLVRRHVNVIGTGELIGFGRAQETERVRKNLDRPRSADFLALLGEFLQDRENQVLLAQRRRVRKSVGEGKRGSER